MASVVALVLFLNGLFKVQIPCNTKWTTEQICLGDQ